MYETAYELLGGDAKKMVSNDSALEIIRAGLPVSSLDKAIEFLDVNKKVLAPMVGINMRSLQRRKATDHLTSQQSEHTLALMEVVSEGVEYFGDKTTAIRWLHTPNLALGKKEPFALMDTIAGILIVKDTINRLKYGMTA